MRSSSRFIPALMIGALLLPAAAAAETVDVTFLLVNDVEQMAAIDGRGGYARIAAVVEAEREARRNVVFVHAGDAISPSLLSGFDQGAHIITLINMLRPDVFVPGNHEYDFGPDVFRKRMSEAEFPRLAANLRGGMGERLPGFEDTRMLDLGGIKIGVVGLTGEDATVKSSPGELRIAPAVATGLNQAAALRAAGADLLVAVAHADRAHDRELLDSRAFDVILSADDHELTLLYNGRTVLMESLAGGAYVVAADLEIAVEEQDGKRRVGWWPDFRVIDTGGVEPDAAVADRVAGFEAEFSKELEAVLGSTDTELDGRRAVIRAGESALGDLIADAMRESVGAEVGLMNSGGIRADKVYPAGTRITRKDILAELPFGNRAVKLEVTGAVLLQALENGFSRIAEGAGRFPQVSGMVVEGDARAPPGKRVVSVMVGKAPLDAARTYTLATNDFIANGGDGYQMLLKAPRILNERDGPLLAAAVMAHIRKHGSVAPVLEGRIKLSD